MRLVAIVVITSAVVVRLVVIVVVVPDVNPVAAVLVAPLHFGLEVRPLAVFVTFDSVVGVSAFVAKVPGVRVGNARVPDSLMDGSKGRWKVSLARETTEVSGLQI